jgi:hypothetical protein
VALCPSPLPPCEGGVEEYIENNCVDPRLHVLLSLALSFISKIIAVIYPQRSCYITVDPEMHASEN